MAILSEDLHIEILTADLRSGNMQFQICSPRKGINVTQFIQNRLQKSCCMSQNIYPFFLAGSGLLQQFHGDVHIPIQQAISWGFGGIGNAVQRQGPIFYSGKASAPPQFYLRGTFTEQFFLPRLKMSYLDTKERKLDIVAARTSTRVAKCHTFNTEQILNKTIENILILCYLVLCYTDIYLWDM